MGRQFTNEIGPTLMKVGYDGGVLFVRLTQFRLLLPVSRATTAPTADQTVFTV